MRRDRLVTFLYCLIRDEVTPGAVESLFERTIDLGDDAGKDIVFSNPFVVSPEQRRVLDRAVEVLRQANFGLMLWPMKVDCIAIHCHPSDEADIRALYDAPIVVDPNQRRGTIGVVPHARAVNIAMSIGFAEPDPPK